ASRGPRTQAVMCVGITWTRPWPSRAFTAISLTDHSTGAGPIVTATRAVCGCRSRTAASATPMLTVSVTGADASVTVTGSVIAFANLESTSAGASPPQAEGP